MRSHIWASLLLVSTLATGCVNMSTLQTGRALAPGTGRVLVGGGYYTSPDLNAAANEANTANDPNAKPLPDLKAPYLEVGYRRGIVENLELGLKLTIPGTIALDGKYQILNLGPFFLAAGVGVGYLSLTSGPADKPLKSSLIDVMVPVYASLEPLSWLAIYVSPKYVFRATNTTGGDNPGSSTTQMVGSSAGLKLGDGTGVFAEGTLLRDLKSKANTFQVSGAVFW